MSDDGRPMLSNFGIEPICQRIAVDITLTSGSALVNSYIPAPEILSPPYGDYPLYSSKSDVYDFGSLMLEVSFGRDEVPNLLTDDLMAGSKRAHALSRPQQVPNLPPSHQG